MTCLNSCQTYVITSKHDPALNLNVSNMNATVMTGENGKDKEIQPSLSAKELTDEQNNDTFCSSIVEVNE